MKRPGRLIPLAATAAVLILASSANAASVHQARSADGFQLVLTGSAARDVIRAEGGHPHKCTRLSRTEIQCDATFWYERHEAEAESDGTLVNEVVTFYSEEEVCIVSISD